MVSKKKIIKSNSDNKLVYVLGAGISGLSLAYYLKRLKGYDVHILEKANEAGGNCRTYDVELNTGKNPLVRWADMGVNDYNKSTYKMLTALMAAANYEEDPLLEDTESYGTLDGSICYTNDGEFQTEMSAEIKADNVRFQKEAYEDMMKPQYAYYTLGDYVKEKKYTEDYINNNLYPRVNAMYFCAGSPAEMPFRGVMSYYSLQEGYGGEKPPARKYFKKGSSTWIQKMVDLLASIDVKIDYDKDAKIIWDKIDKPRLIVNGKEIEGLEAVVLAMPADEAIKAFGGSMNTPKEVLDVLVQFPYITDQAIAHTDVRPMQPQVNSWRTYNIHIYNSKAFNYGPYSIDYVVNRHQNDPINGLYNKNCQNPQYFVSLNPVVPPAPSSILNRPAGMGKAITEFRHQKLSVNTILAQERLDLVQGKFGLWYVNGYALGAGLHEECLHHAYDIAHRIWKKPNPMRARYAVHADADLLTADQVAQYAPDYIVNAHKTDRTAKAANQKSNKDKNNKINQKKSKTKKNGK